jgi:hypothetical protein
VPTRATALTGPFVTQVVAGRFGRAAAVGQGRRAGPPRRPPASVPTSPPAARTRFHRWPIVPLRGGHGYSPARNDGVSQATPGGQSNRPAPPQLSGASARGIPTSTDKERLSWTDRSNAPSRRPREAPSAHAREGSTRHRRGDDYPHRVVGTALRLRPTARQSPLADTRGASPTRESLEPGSSSRDASPPTGCPRRRRLLLGC